MNDVIYLINTNNLDVSKITEILKEYISQDEKNHLIKFDIKDNKSLSIIASSCLRKILIENFNFQKENLEFYKSKNGKPFIKDCNNIFFNISHSGSVIGIAFSSSEIGLDIEKIKPFNKKIVTKYFTKEENNYIFKDRGLENIRFFEIWTKKEAIIKYLGESIFYLKKNQFNVLNKDFSSHYFYKSENDYALSVYKKSSFNNIKIINYLV